MKKGRVIFIPIVALIIATACNKVPDYVIQPDDMAEIMAEIHIAEAFAENNYNEYATDSARMLLKQSVVKRHGYDLETLDTSFMWYGAHLGLYSDVYEKSIEIIEKRLNENDDYVRKQNVGGDSTDIWTYSSYLMVKSTAPTQYLTYNFIADESWKPGDSFTLRAKFNNISGNPAWTMTSEYDDGSFEILTNKFAGDGWHEMTFYTDSLKNTQKIYGAFNFDVNRGTMVIDSLELIRKPLNAKTYSLRYRQKSYNLSEKRNKSAKNEEVVE